LAKLKELELVDDICKFRCSLYGACKGKVRADGCLGYKDKIGIKKAPTGDVSSEHRIGTSLNQNPTKLYTFESRNATLKGNNSICDDCDHELDGLCKLKQKVHLSTVKDCDALKPRQQYKAVG